MTTRISKKEPIRVKGKQKINPALNHKLTINLPARLVKEAHEMYDCEYFNTVVYAWALDAIGKIKLQKGKTADIQKFMDEYEKD